LAELISDKELGKRVRSANFRCPQNPPRDPRDCDGRDCPVKPAGEWQEPSEDYYHECVNSLHAKQKLRRILAGELRVASPIKLIKLRRRLKKLVEKKPVATWKYAIMHVSELLSAEEETR